MDPVENGWQRNPLTFRQDYQIQVTPAKASSLADKAYPHQESDHIRRQLDLSPSAEGPLKRGAYTEQIKTQSSGKIQSGMAKSRYLEALNDIERQMLFSSLLPHEG